MWRALLVKELRETAWITLPAAAVYVVFILSTMRIQVIPDPIRFLVLLDYGRPGGADIPFVSSAVVASLGWIGGLMALALGFWQTLGEERQGTYPVLLHLPLARRRVIAAKLAAGIGLLWGMGGLAIVIQMLWAALPGTHPSPFEWSMTVPAWRMLLLLSLIYLGAFLAGLRPARWFGSRLFPLGAAILFVAGGPLMVLSTVPHLVIWLVVGSAYLLVIDHVAQSRDFS